MMMVVAAVVAAAGARTPGAKREPGTITVSQVTPRKSVPGLGTEFKFVLFRVRGQYIAQLSCQNF